MQALSKAMLGSLFNGAAQSALGATASGALQHVSRTLMTSMPSPGDGQTKLVTLIPGDGIGPEVTNAVVREGSRIAGGGRL